MSEARTTVFAGKRTRRGSAIGRPPRVGDALGSYRLCVELGSGGMAVVFLAQSARPGAHRFVALKCIRPDLARTPHFVEMFLDEAKLASLVHHPNACAVLDCGQHHGTYFLAMELLAGKTLTALQHELQVAHDAGEPVSRAAMFARILEHACEGLHAAHEARDESGEPLGIVHRDVSPDNLFVTFDGNVKVIDFGVAYASDKLNATRTGVVKGKCRYLAPEVIAGAKPDRAADIWGLGVVMWEMITQRKLFDQPTDPAILHAIVQHEIPRPSKVRDGLPPELDDIVMRALERDPAKRYASARDFGRTLNWFIADHRHVVGAADIADVMHAYFPEGVACARQLIRVAEQLDAPPRTRSRPPPLEEPTVADPPLVRELARRSAGKPATEPKRRRVRGWLLLAALMVAVAASTAFACLHASVVTSTTELQPDELTLEATPAGVDESGAILLRVRIVRKHP